MCFHLGLEGYECVPVTDGNEALALANEKTFDVIILDLMLPGMDGITICRALRRQGANRDTPILMLTAPEESRGVGAPRGRRRPLRARTDDDIDGFDFKVDDDVRTLRFTLNVDGDSPARAVTVGRDNLRPANDPFVVDLR